MRELRTAGERRSVSAMLRGSALRGATLLRQVRGTDGVRSLRVWRVFNPKLRVRGRAGTFTVLGGGGRARTRSQVQGVPPRRGEGDDATHGGRPRWWSFRRGGAGAPAPFAAREAGLQPGGAHGARAARRINAPVLDKLKVVRRTRDQVELSASDRRTNVAGAFAPRGPVAGKILLVDDVFTMGATLSECAGVLRKAGASEIHALTLCRTL